MIEAIVEMGGEEPSMRARKAVLVAYAENLFQAKNELTVEDITDFVEDKVDDVLEFADDAKKAITTGGFKWWKAAGLTLVALLLVIGFVTVVPMPTPPTPPVLPTPF